MKIGRIAYLGCVLLLAFLAGCGGASDQTARVQQLDPSPAPFDVLNPYGEWLDLPGRGEVWRPNVTYDWAPFTNGQWAWTDRGWMWLSDEPYGWVVYHYGYWDYQEGMGWVWVPGYDWSPARVRWYVSDDYVGWAPLPPPGVLLPSPGEDHDRWWSVVPAPRFTQERVGHYRTSGFRPGAGTVGSSAPDVRAMRAMADRDIPMARIETDRIRAGTHELLRVRPFSTDLRATPSPPPRPVPEPQPMDLPRGQARGASPAPPAQPAPKQPRGESRRSTGGMRTPDTNPGAPSRNARRAPEDAARPAKTPRLVPADSTGKARSEPKR